jgi:alpha/beta superfamily hydrolase
MLILSTEVYFFCGPKENIMQTPAWLKPGLHGAVALAVIGFSWGGWVTGGTARTMAADQSKAEVVTALSLICVDQSKRDPQLVERVALLKAASSYERGDLVMKNGWATMPGTTEGNRLVAIACADKVGV